MRREPTDAQKAKAAERRARFKTLAQQLADMSEEQRAEMAATMGAVVTTEGRVLSVGNTCLLACQCPTATMVGGFNQWRAAGRMVRKGEHGSMIWAPIKGKTAHTEQPSVSDVDSEHPNFIMVTVFDVGQTDAITEEQVA